MKEIKTLSPSKNSYEKPSVLYFTGFIESKNQLLSVIQKLLHLDRELLEDVNRLNHPLLESFLNAYTALGSVYLTFLFLGVAWKLGSRAFIQNVSIGLLATWTLVYGIKHLVKRSRPENNEEVVVTKSFPSGHSATAFFLAVTLSQILPFSFLLYVLAGIVAFSRIYLNLHYPLDAFAGSSIGLLAGYLTLIIA